MRIENFFENPLRLFENFDNFPGFFLGTRMRGFWTLGLRSSCLVRGRVCLLFASSGACRSSATVMLLIPREAVCHKFVEGV